jgi:hypothetical protein
MVGARAELNYKIVLSPLDMAGGDNAQAQCQP